MLASFGSQVTEPLMLLIAPRTFVTDICLTTKVACE